MCKGVLVVAFLQMRCVGGVCWWYAGSSSASGVLENHQQYKGGILGMDDVLKQTTDKKMAGFVHTVVDGTNSLWWPASCT